MIAGIYFTGTGPILILTTYDTLDDAKIVEKLAAKGIRKFIAYKIPVKKVKERYSTYYTTVLGDLLEEGGFRVLDYDGHNVFENFNLEDLDAPVIYEPDLE